MSVPSRDPRRHHHRLLPFTAKRHRKNLSGQRQFLTDHNMIVASISPGVHARPRKRHRTEAPPIPQVYPILEHPTPLDIAYHTFTTQAATVQRPPAAPSRIRDCITPELKRLTRLLHRGWITWRPAGPHHSTPITPSPHHATQTSHGCCNCTPAATASHQNSNDSHAFSTEDGSHGAAGPHHSTPITPSPHHATQTSHISAPHGRTPP
jgi:hypothetical protein